MQHLVDVDDTQLVLHEAVVDGARPVLFLGRGRVGKSTIANKLLGVAGYNGESFPQIPGVNAVTRGVDCVYVADNGLVVMDCEGADNGEETASLLSALYGACIYSAHTVVLVCADHISDADIRVLARGVIASSYICGQQVTRRLVFVINKMDPDADNPEPHDYLHSKLYGTNPAMAFYCG
jgi:predicted GTPase